MLSKGSRVLDVGCAAGRDSSVLRDAGIEVLGIDLSKSFLMLAQERVSGVEFQHMDARKLNFEHNTFDGIWAQAILLNLDRLEVPGVLKGFWRVLKQGGVCFISVKKGKGEKFIGETLVDNMKRRETYFEKFEMESLLRDVGFAIKKSCIQSDSLGRSATKWVNIFARK